MLISFPFRKKNIYFCKVSLIRVTTEQDKQMNAVMATSESNKTEEMFVLTCEPTWSRRSMKARSTEWD